MHVAKFDPRHFLTLKRRRKTIVKRRRLFHRHQARLRAFEHRHSKAVEFGASSLVAGMLSHVATKELSLPQTSLRVHIPKIFSISESPEDAIELISSFALTHKNRSLSDVFVDFSDMERQDLGAHALLDKLVDEISTQAKFRKTRIAWKGNFPRDPALKRFLRAMGIIRQLGIKHHYLESDVASKIHVFERCCRHYIRKIKPTNPLEKTEQANAAERFAKHLNRCLNRNGKELTEEARGMLCSYVAEIIDNAENHAGMVDWTIQGYLDMALNQPACEIVIFNFGKSISETLDALPDESYTKEQIRPYMELHSQRGWFGKTWRKEDLLTLIALQSQVSSRNTSDDTTRGQGTVELIDFFQRMSDALSVEGANPATMYILSGSTRIIFDGKYRLQTADDGSKFIAFNEGNDLNQPPDPAYVKPLRKGSLPGTMIGIKFPIHARNLRETHSSE